VLVRPGLFQGLTCGSHGSDENLLLSVRGSGSDLSHGCGVTLLLLAVATTCCSSMERLEVLLGMVSNTMVIRGGGGGQR
jgi:hypothetical protein